MKRTAELHGAPLPGAARVASLSVLLLSLACGDKPGARPAAASASEQALTRRTSPPPTRSTGAPTRTSPRCHRPRWWAPSPRRWRRMDATPLPRPGPHYPQGWSIEYYAGGTKLAKEPSTASEWAQVSRVVTTGSLKVEALDGDRQAIVSTVDAPPATVASSFSGGSAGDGWDVFFDPAYTKVFNIHHHNGPATLMCRTLADSKTCPGFPLQLTQTALRSTGRIDAGTHKLWQPTVTSVAAYWRGTAWTSPPPRAAPRRWWSPSTPRPTLPTTTTRTGGDRPEDVRAGLRQRRRHPHHLSGHGHRRRVPRNSAAAEQQSQNFFRPRSGGRQALRALRPRPEPGLLRQHHLGAVRGSWPKAVSGQSRVGGAECRRHRPQLCANTQCFALDGSAHTLPPNFAAYLAANPVVGLSVTSVQAGNATSLGTKAAWSI